jgi:hypothetical protein
LELLDVAVAMPASLRLESGAVALVTRLARLSHQASREGESGIMVMVQTIVTLLYYALVAFVCVLLIWNLIRTRDWKEEVLYVIVLIPFLLRLFWLK